PETSHHRESDESAPVAEPVHAQPAHRAPAPRVEAPAESAAPSVKETPQTKTVEEAPAPPARLAPPLRPPLSAGGGGAFSPPAIPMPHPAPPRVAPAAPAPAPPVAHHAP